MTFREFLYRESRIVIVEDIYHEALMKFMETYHISYEYDTVLIHNDDLACVYTIYSTANIKACEKLVRMKLDELRKESKLYLEYVEHD